MTRALVFALTCTIAYMILAGCAPDLASDLGLLYGTVIIGAWLFLVLTHERGRR